uniref:Uncharacterized protein n=1 Tax=Arundo donax TaxID=35708 RepID=A0A0A9BQ33_ARUDO
MNSPFPRRAPEFGSTATWLHQQKCMLQECIQRVTI